MIACKQWKQALFILLGTAFIMCSLDDEKAYLKPPQFVGKPGAKNALIDRQFQGIPSLAVSPGGRLWATWYAGKTPDEDYNNYVVIATSDDNGHTWDETLTIDPDGDGPVRAFDPELWIDPVGKLWALWAQAIEHEGSDWGVWAITSEEPDKKDGKWSQPRRLCDGILMCKPTVLSSGEWMFPVASWHTDNGSKAVVSTDNGRTFHVKGACNVPEEHRNCDEPMIVEKKDGSLWMLVRTSYGIGESISHDHGETWNDLTPSSIQHATARFFIRRLKSGNLLLVKHGPIEARTKRSHLTAYLSKDDGEIWSSGLLLDERISVSYPDGQQTADGTIYIIYDRSRRNAREILMATFMESDVEAGDPESATVSLRNVVSRYSQSEDKE